MQTMVFPVILWYARKQDRTNFGSQINKSSQCSLSKHESSYFDHIMRRPSHLEKDHCWDSTRKEKRYYLLQEGWIQLQRQ